jgi:hypothetical protein
MLINSMPKSGTHLLTQVVTLLGYKDFGAHDTIWPKVKDRLGFGAPVVLAHLRVKRNWARRLAALGHRDGETIPVDVTMPVQTPVSLAGRWLRAIPPGHYLSGHVPWSAATANLIRTTGLKHLIIIRDPRDVLVSFVHFVSRPEHILSQDFAGLSADQRVRLALTGGRGPRSGLQIIGLSDAFASIMAWQREPDVLFVRFEALIGEQGDGSGAEQQASVRAICQHLALAHDNSLIEQVCLRAFDTGAATFRRGKIGSWRDELTPDQIDWANQSFGSWLADYV